MKQTLAIAFWFSALIITSPAFAAESSVEAPPKIQYIKIETVDIETSSELEPAAKNLNLSPADFDFSVGGVPLDNIDDPKPLDCGEKEFNYFGETDRARRGDITSDFHFDLNWGRCFQRHFLRNVQLKFEGGYAFKHSENQAGYKDGLSDYAFGVKIPLYDGKDSSNGLLQKSVIGIYPTIRTEPFGNSARRGIAEPGRVYVLPLLISKQMTIKNVATALTANVGIERGAQGAPNEWFWAVGGGFAVTPINQFVMSYSQETLRALGPSKIAKVEVGFTKALSTHYRLIAMIGKQLNFSTNIDGKPHLLANFGIQYSYKPSDDQRPVVLLFDKSNLRANTND